MRTRCCCHVSFSRQLENHFIPRSLFRNGVFYVTGVVFLRYLGDEGRSPPCRWRVNPISMVLLQGDLVSMRRKERRNRSSLFIWVLVVFVLGSYRDHGHECELQHHPTTLTIIQKFHICLESMKWYVAFCFFSLVMSLVSSVILWHLCLCQMLAKLDWLGTNLPRRNDMKVV